MNRNMSSYVYKDDCEIEVLARSSKNGEIGQNTLYSFSLARLIFTGQTSHLDMTYPKHSSFFRTFYLSIDLYARTVMAL